MYISLTAQLPGHETPLKFGGGWRIKMWYIFHGLSFVRISAGLLCSRGLHHLRYFLAHKLQHKQLTIYFHVFLFHEDFMKILYFPKNSLNIFSLRSMFLCTCLKVRLPDYVALLHTTVLGMTGPGKYLFSIKFISLLSNIIPVIIPMKGDVLIQRDQLVE